MSFWVPNINDEWYQLLQDNLSGMGDFIDDGYGSYAWTEAAAITNNQYSILQELRTLALQLDPAQATVFLFRYAEIYLNAPNLNPTVLSNFIKTIEMQTGTIPSCSNVAALLYQLLGNATSDGYFVDLEWIPLQTPIFASFAPPGYSGALFGTTLRSIVSSIILHCWIPRDKNDNILVPVNTVNAVLSTWQPYILSWIPATANMYVVTPGYAGCNSGGHSNVNDGYNNPVNITAMDYVVTSTLPAWSGSGTKNGYSDFYDDFLLVKDGYTTNGGVLFEYVDDNNNLNTNYVVKVQSRNQLTLLYPPESSATARTFRTYGIQAGIQPIGYSHCCGS